MSTPTTTIQQQQNNSTSISAGQEEITPTHVTIPPQVQSSTKLVQLQVQAFIQDLNQDELSKLLEIFEKSLLSPTSVIKNHKMVSYKCYESKIELNGKIGCGFGRSQEEALAISVKDFFNILLLEEKYLYIVKECFRQMKGQTQQAQQNTSQTPQQIQNINLPNNPTKESQNSTENSPILHKSKKQLKNQQKHENNQVDQINAHYQMDQIDNLMSLTEIQINDSNVYELSKKIGNISVINGPNIVASTQFNNNSQQDIDEMLLKIIFEEEKKQQMQQNNQQYQNNSKFHLDQQLQQMPSQKNQIKMNFSEYLNNLQKNNKLPNQQENKIGLTQFQIYQMQQQQQQQQHNQHQQYPSQQLQYIQQHFNDNQNQQESYFQPINNAMYSQPQVTSNHLYQLQQQQQQQIDDNNDNISIENEVQEIPQENLQTPPKQNKRLSSLNMNRAQQVNQQLNDTAFMPIKNQNNNNNNLKNNASSTAINSQNTKQNNLSQNQNNTSNYSQSNQNQKLVNNSSQQSHQNSQQHQSSQQSLQQQSIYQMNSNTNVNSQNQFNLQSNKENSLQQGNNSTSNLVGKNNYLQNNISSVNQQNIQRNSSKQNLYQQSSLQSQNCCSHAEELERERNKVENLEKRIKLLIDENKILKSMLLDNESNPLKNKISSRSSNQTPRQPQPKLQNASSQINNNENNSNKIINNKNIDNNIFENIQQDNNIQQINLSDHKNQKFPHYQQTQMRSQSQGHKQYSNSIVNDNLSHISGQKKNINNSDSKNSFLYGSSGKYVNQNADYLDCSHLSLNNSIQLNHSSVKKAVPKLNLKVLPNYHGKFNRSQNNQLLSDYNSKYANKKRI